MWNKGEKRKGKEKEKEKASANNRESLEAPDGSKSTKARPFIHSPDLILTQPLPVASLRICRDVLRSTEYSIQKTLESRLCT
jgi:hypothetical protein